MITESGQIGFISGNEILPLGALPRPKMAHLSNVANGGQLPGIARKGLYSAIIETGNGLETIALITEHGTNALMPGGPYSLAPFRDYVDLGREVLDALHDRCSVDVLFQALRARLVEGPNCAKIFSETDTQTIAEETACLELPGFSALPLPTPSEWYAFQQTLAGLARFCGFVEKASLDRLRFALALSLCKCGLPLKNLRKRHRTYRFGSFISVDERCGFFAALTRQADNGLGILLLPLEHSDDCLSCLLAEFGKRSGYGQRQRLFADFNFSRVTFARFVRQLLSKVEAEAAGWGDGALLAMLERGSTLVAMMKLGGFLTFSLRDELIVPANFFEPTDLLNGMGIATQQLYGVDRLPWRNPYVPTQEQLDRALDDRDFFELLSREVSAVRRGRPRKLPSWYSQRAEDIESIDYPLITRLVAFYKPWPRLDFLRELAIRAGCKSEILADRKALCILAALSRNGWLQVGKPCRYLSPLSMIEFLKQVLDVELVNRVPNPITRAKLCGIVLTMATTGMRLAEALRIRNGDILRIGSYETIRIRGTKVARARREVPLDLFRAGPGGEKIFDEWRSFILERSGTLQHGELLLSNEAEGSKRTSDLLRRILDAAFQRVRGVRDDTDVRIRGAFTAYSLRHLAALRLVQGAIDSDFRHGNFNCALAQVAAAMGHALPTLLSSYVGTAATMLDW